MTAPTATEAPAAQPAKTEHVDVLIVGAGISGIGAAYHLLTQRPGTTFTILETMDHFGGTWWTHKYPGIRSDSDLHTFGYRFKPWTGTPIATAEEILKYMGEVIEENDIAQYIRYSHKVATASWSSADKQWTIEGKNTATGEAVRFTCNFLWMCQGYYRHSEGYTPEWEGMDTFEGQIVHPQTWPNDLDLTDKEVIVIGSGATAATLIPNIAGKTKHTTMLQRSPTYFIPGRNRNDLAEQLRALQVDETWIHEIVRRQIIKQQADFTKRCIEDPDGVSRELLGAVRAYLGPDYDIETHFTPNYRPWRQRIAFIPEGDMFVGIREGKASVVTDEIDRFVPQGILLKSGEVLPADVIVTATGFNMSVMGDVNFSKDGEPVIFKDTVTYRGMLFTGVPNMVWVFGYFRASWTLRADMVADFVCRLLAHMEQKGARSVEMKLRPEDADMEILPWIDEDNFNPGYLLRAMEQLPKRGSKREWAHTQDYWAEKDEFPLIDLDGPEFVYSK